MTSEDDIADFLDLRPLDEAENEVVLYDPETGEVLDSDGVPVLAVTETEDVDPYDAAMQDAEDDFVSVRENIHTLMRDGMSLFKTARDLAVNSQDPDHISGAARVFAETLRANRELMNIHKDRVAMRPPAPVQQTQQASTINNIVFKGTQSEMLDQLRSMMSSEEGMKALDTAPKE